MWGFGVLGEGACTSYLLEQRFNWMNERLRVVAFTDAVGVGSDQQGPADWLAQHSVNFVTSTKVGIGRSIDKLFSILSSLFFHAFRHSFLLPTLTLLRRGGLF